MRRLTVIPPYRLVKLPRERHEFYAPSYYWRAEAEVTDIILSELYVNG